jgi:hypothetical protein
MGVGEASVTALTSSGTVGLNGDWESDRGVVMKEEGRKIAVTSGWRLKIEEV